MSRGTKPVTKARCPICSELATEAYRPFCSRRCADIDLGRWFRGQYRIPSDEPVADEQDGATGGSEDEDPPRH